MGLMLLVIRWGGALEQWYGAVLMYGPNGCMGIVSCSCEGSHCTGCTGSADCKDVVYLGIEAGSVPGFELCCNLRIRCWQEQFMGAAYCSVNSSLIVLASCEAANVTRFICGQSCGWDMLGVVFLSLQVGHANVRGVDYHGGLLSTVAAGPGLMITGIPNSEILAGLNSSGCYPLRPYQLLSYLC
ncbi:hypothetical protein Nepgr_006603 [Nepenthes gracilis]|uniref:Uncharacterized protein n=1 Tax=Nepenthes gracilis TaxID=150966 RepID=A0AAD3S5G6_NEPGR|nr:hypothetical protein Nepgr_006603 [Nepenthes gracilis]